MTNSFLDKIKPLIEPELILKFDSDAFNTEKYIPVCVYKGSVCIIATKKTNQAAVKDTVVKIAQNDKINFKIVSEDDFSSLFSYIKSDILNENEKLDLNLQTNNDAGPAADVSDDNSLSDKADIKIKYEDNFDEDSNVAPDDGSSLAPIDNVKNNKYYGKKIGEILVQMGFVSNEEIFHALVLSKKQQIPLGTILVQNGTVKLNDLKKALEAQLGFKAVTDEQLKISDDTLKVLPEDFMKINKVLPISFDEKSLVVAMVNPNDKRVINDVIFLTSLQPKVLILTHYEFFKCVQAFFSEQKRSTNIMSRKVEKETIRNRQEETLFEQAQRELKDDSSIIVKFVNKILSDGIDMKVSDIHIEPRVNGYIVRYRKDGILKVALQLPKNSESTVLTRFKVMSKMNIAEHRRPQDGSFSITYKGLDYDFRINTLPVGTGEKMVIRILAPTVTMASSKDKMVLAGASQEEISLIQKLQSVPNGIILATGPTGSGKTTTLYTLLKAINKDDVNITTIEDPIEIRIDGINQSQINVKAGITFASYMRAVLRQDPDVILVGEIRDLETLETAINAALTGHLVLSTIHTNSAAATITRLINMGAKDYLISSTLVGVIAQRLVRSLCPHCKTQRFPTREEAELVIPGGEKEIQEFLKTSIYYPVGCNKCNFEGYAGRIGVYEILPITKEIKKLIAQGAHDIEIEEAAVGSGMKTLHQCCLRHIIDGKTTISEFVRVLGPVKE